MREKEKILGKIIIFILKAFNFPICRGSMKYEQLLHFAQEEASKIESKIIAPRFAR
jgi:hypothetical protein